MKNIYFLTLLFTLGITSLPAQMTSPIRVKAGEDLYEKLAKEVFLYPAFIKGIVQFRNGRASQALLNYNMLISEMQFISAKGDTLALADEATIKNISIAKDTFYYNEGYFQFVSGNTGAKVTKTQAIKIVDHQKIGGYDQPTSTGSISSYNSIAGNLKTFNLDVRQDVVLAKITNFFIADKFNNFFRPNKKNLLKYFPKKEIELNNYLRDNNVNFDKEEDLTRLVTLLKDY